MSIEEDMAIEVFFSVPAAIRTELSTHPDFEPHLEKLNAKAIQVANGLTFSVNELFKALSKIINQPGSSTTLDTLDKQECKLVSDKNGFCECHLDGEIVRLPDTRVLSNDLEVRKRSLIALTADCLTRQDFERWQNRIEQGPLSGTEALELGADIGYTPEAYISDFDQVFRTGTLRPDLILPTSNRYRRRLSGAYASAESISSFAKKFKRDRLAFLSYLPRRQKWHRAFALCNHSLLTDGLPFEIKSIREASALIDWTISMRSPVVTVSVIEYLLPRFHSQPELDEGLTKLIESFLAFDPSNEATEYLVFARLLMIAEGLLAQRHDLSDAPVFYRRYVSSAHASFIQTFSSHSFEDISAMAERAFELFGPFAVMQAILDTKQHPRWNPDWYSPVDLFADHMGRVHNAFSISSVSPDMTKLTKLMNPKLEDGFYSQMKWLEAHQCGFLEGDQNPPAPNDPKWREAVDEQLSETPFTVRSMIAFVSAPTFGQFSDEQFEKLKNTIDAFGFYLRDIESEDQANAIFVALASLSVVRRDQDFAKSIGSLLRRHSRHVRHAIHPVVYFRTSVWLSRAFDNELESYAWLAQQTEFVSFSQLSEEKMLRLVGEIQIACRVAPDLRIPLSRSIKALQVGLRASKSAYGVG